MRGSECGVTSRMASQFTIVTASWLAASSESTTTSASSSRPAPAVCALATRPAAKPPVSTPIAPR